MTLHGLMKNGFIVLDQGAVLPEGTEVEVRPLPAPTGDPLALIAAMDADPHLEPEDIAELQQAIRNGKRRAPAIDPFALHTPEAG